MQIHGLCVFSLLISLTMVVRIRVLYLYIIIKSEVWPICHCLVLGHRTMACAVCLSKFLWWLSPKYSHRTLHIWLMRANYGGSFVGLFIFCTCQCHWNVAQYVTGHYHSLMDHNLQNTSIQNNITINYLLCKIISPWISFFYWKSSCILQSTPTSILNPSGIYKTQMFVHHGLKQTSAAINSLVPNDAYMC